MNSEYAIEIKIRKIVLQAILVCGLIMTLTPFFWMISTSFKSNAGIHAMPPQWLPKEPTLSHYRALFEEINFFRYFVNSTIVAVIVTALGLFFNSLAGYAFAKFRFPGRDRIFAILIIALMVPSQVTMMPVFLILKKFGLLNSYMGLIVSGTISVYSIFLMRQFVMTIPNELIESARIDGCSEIGIYWKIIMPLCKPVLATLGIFTFMSSWNSFLWPLIVMIREEMYTLPVALANLSGQHAEKFGLVMAGAVIVVIPVIIVFLFAQKYIIEGISTTGLKG
ncbi:MAG: carbohydrate ABC transporter permease [Elusimicrobiota bacterium]